MNRNQELAIQALSAMKGDDYARARRAFANYSSEALNAEYGQSGLTCRQILANYEKNDNEINAAIAWVRSA